MMVMTPARCSEPFKSALRGVLSGVLVSLWAGCSVSTSIGAISPDSSAPAERPSNPDRSGERWPNFEARDASSGREPWLLDNGRPCTSGRSQSCDGVGEFCDIYSFGCTGGDGLCMHVLPENCPAAAAFSLVCGCDNVTYGNTCLRLAARVSLQYQGACR